MASDLFTDRARTPSLRRSPSSQLPATINTPVTMGSDLGHRTERRTGTGQVRRPPVSRSRMLSVKLISTVNGMATSRGRRHNANGGR